MRKTNWQAMEKRCKQVKKKIKTDDGLTMFLNERTLPGYIYDVKNKETLKIQEIPRVSTLNRIFRNISNFYYQITDDEEKKYVLSKRIELEVEISKRLPKE